MGNAVRASDETLTISEVYRRFADAVVQVSIVPEDPTGRSIPDRFLASGFFIDQEGRFLTKIGKSRNVLRAWIEKDGINLAAEMIGADPRTELGLFQVSQLPAHAAAIPVNTATEKLAPGTPIVAIARPLGLMPTPSWGMITAHESNFLKDTIFPCTYIRTNILFGLGEHGGPVFGMNGSLVGIAVVNVPNLVASYVVPARALARIIPELIKNGRVDYVTLHLEFGQEPDAQNTELLVKITNVEPGSPAERAGLHPGDVVRRIGDTPIHSIDDVRDVLFYARPDDRFITIVVERGSRLQTTFTLPLDKLNEDSALKNIPAATDAPNSAPTPTPAASG